MKTGTNMGTFRRSQCLSWIGCPCQWRVVIGEWTVNDSWMSCPSISIAVVCRVYRKCLVNLGRNIYGTIELNYPLSRRKRYSCLHLYSVHFGNDLRSFVLWLIVFNRLPGAFNYLYGHENKQKSANASSSNLYLQGSVVFVLYSWFWSILRYFQ